MPLLRSNPQDALEDAKRASRGLVVEPLAAGFAVVRGDLGAPLFQAALRTAGVELPAAPCTFRSRAGAAAYWLGPGEWLLAAFGGASGWAPPQLADGIVVDVSGAYVAWRLGGRGALSVLRQATSCDVHPRAFPPGRCAGTVFAKAAALLAAHPAGAFELIVRRSYGDYVRRYLAAAGEEHGVYFAPTGGGAA